MLQVGFFAAEVSACCVTNPNIPSTTCGPQTFAEAPSPIALGPGEIGAFDYGVNLASFPDFNSQPLPLSCYCNFTVAVVDDPASNISINFQPVVRHVLGASTVCLHASRAFARHIKHASLTLVNSGISCP